MDGASPSSELFNLRRRALDFDLPKASEGLATDRLVTRRDEAGERPGDSRLIIALHAGEVEIDNMEVFCAVWGCPVVSDLRLVEPLDIGPSRLTWFIFGPASRVTPGLAPGAQLTRRRG